MLSLDITKKIKKPITRSSVQNKLSSENNKKQLTGFIVYVILILMFIPYMLYLYYPMILTFYIPNVDMIANILTTINKPEIFSKLYVSEPNNILSYISLNLINWISPEKFFLNLDRRLPASLEDDRIMRSPER